MNSSNNARPYAHGLQANKMLNERLRLDIVEVKFPKLNEYTAQLKPATRRARAGNSELYIGRMDGSSSDGNLPNWMG